MESPVKEGIRTLYETTTALSATTQGICYQLKLLMLLMLRGVENNYDFKLGAEVKKADKFDDVTFEFTDHKNEDQSVLIQLKHRQNKDKTISVEELLSADEKTEFSIPKYFRSWRKLNGDGHYNNIKSVVLYTNIRLDHAVLNVVNVESGIWSEILKTELEHKAPIQYRLMDQNDVLFHKLMLTSLSYSLANKLCEHLFSGKIERLEGNELMKSYHVPLCVHVLSLEDVRKKKVASLRPNFFENKAEDVRHFQEQMEQCLKSRNNSIDDAMKQIMMVPDNFGKDKRGVENLVNSRLPHEDCSLPQDIRKFTKIFLLCVNQPTEEELGDIIIHKMKKMFECSQTESIYNDFWRQTMDWFKKCEQEYKKVYYTKETAKLLFSSLKDRVHLLKVGGFNAEYPSRLDKYNLQFKSKSVELSAFFKSDRRLFHLNTSHTLLGATLVLQTWRETPEVAACDCIFIELSSLLQRGTYNAVESALRVADNCLLVLECNVACEEYTGLTLASKLSHTRMIVVAGPQHSLVRAFRQRVASKQELIGFKDLTVASQKRIFNTDVCFQGRPVKLGDILSKNEESIHLIDNNTLEALVKKYKRIKLGYELKSSHDYDSTFYIPRLFLQDIVIYFKKEIFTDRSIADLIAVSGVSEEELRGMVGPGPKIHSCSGNSDCHIAARFYILDADNTERDFAMLCELYMGKNIHWLNIENQKIWLVKSNGRNISIMKYRLSSWEENTSGNTNAYSNRSLLESCNHANIIISDGAGMGKSTVLRALAKTIAELSPATWIIRIDLNDYSSVLDELINNKTSWKAEDILIDKLLKSDARLNHDTSYLSDKLLRNWLSSKEQRRVVIMLDAVDEISPDYTQVVTGLMQGLQKANTRLIVTTRPHMCLAVEQSLGVLAFSLQPLSTMDQSLFLLKFWRQQLGSVPEGRVLLYAEMLVNKINESLSGEKYEDSLQTVFRSFCGIPLQLRMLAELYADVSGEDHQGCKQFCESLSPLPQLPSRIEINKLYELFVHKKIEILLLKQGMDLSKVSAKQTVEKERRLLMVKYKRLAVLGLLSEHVQSLLSPEQQEQLHADLAAVQEGELNEGLVTGVTDGRPVFIHRTFGEFFVAKFFLDYNDKQKEDYEKQIFLFRNILIKYEYKIIRQFINSEIKREKMVSFLENMKKHDKFYDNKIYNITKTAIKEGLSHILEYAIITNRKIKNKTDSFLVTAVSNKQILSLQTLLQHSDNLDKTAESGNTLLHMCAKENWYEGVRCLCEHGAEVNVKNEHGETPLHCVFSMAEVKQDIVEHLVAQGALTDLKDNRGRSPLLLAVQANKPSIVMLLLKSGSDINSRNNEGVSVLQAAIQHCDHHLVQRLLGAGAAVDTVSHWDLMMKAVYSESIYLLSTALCLGTDINVSDHYGSTLLPKCAKKGWYEGVRWLCEHGAALNTQNDRGETALHCLLNSSDIKQEIVRYLVSQGARTNLKDNIGQTPLLLAIRKQHSSIVKLLSRNGRDTPREHYQKHFQEQVLSEAGDHWNLMMDAVYSQDVQHMSILFQNGIDINMSENNGDTLLHVCAGLAWQEGVEWLCQQVVQINSQNIYGETALHCHINSAGSHQHIVQCLLSHGASMGMKDNKGRTALLTAVWRNKSSIVELLLDSGSDINVKDNDGLSVLQAAIKYCDNNLVQYLLGRGVAVDVADHWNHIRVAVYSKDVQHMTSLLQHRININVGDDSGDTLLHMCARKAWYEGAVRLCEYGAQLNNQNNSKQTTLHCLIENAAPCLNMVQYFLAQDAPLDLKDNEGYTPLMLAVRKNKPEIAMLLVEAGSDVNCRSKDGKSVLQNSIQYCDGHLVQYLLKKGAVVETADHWTLMMNALHSEEVQNISILLDYGIDINVTDNNGDTPLHICARKAWHEGIKWLCEHGARINMQNAYKETTLHYQINSAGVNRDIVQYLLSQGVPTGVKDSKGRTALLVAVWRNKSSIVELLLDSGSDINAKDNDGVSVLQAAIKCCDNNLVQYLLEKQATFNVTDHWNLMMKAVYSRNICIFSTVLNHGVDVNLCANKGDTLLHMFAWLGWYEGVVQLCEHGAELNAQNVYGKTALHCLITRYTVNKTILRYLLTRGAQTDIEDAKGRTPLLLAIELNIISVVEELVEFKCDINYRNSDKVSGLLTAIKYRNHQLVRFLLKKRAEINPADHVHIITSLISYKNIQMLILLLRNGLNVGILDDNGNTLLHRCAWSGWYEGVVSLCEHDAELNGQNRHGETAIHCVINNPKENLNIVQYLLSQKVRIDLKDKLGQTPLMLAVRRNKASTVHLLVESGCDLNSKDNEGTSVLQNSIKYCEDRLVQYLQGKETIASTSAR